MNCYKEIKRALFTTLFLGVFFVLSISTTFAEEQSSEVKSVKETSIAEEFSITEESLADIVDLKELSFLSENMNSLLTSDSLSESVVNFGNLQITSGLNKERFTTFSSSRTITGTGTEGTIVGLLVFRINTATSRDIVVTQDSLVTIGKSTLFNEKINFDTIGVNYALIATKDKTTGNTVIKLYRITRKTEETKEKLENIRLNLINGESNTNSGIQNLVPNVSGLGF
ncbi:MAG: hypothetical protein JW708_02810 [Vallitaleaceae bacterium]|nr:hypothetical protein [Vallitaleaceae bacterium]